MKLNDMIVKATPKNRTGDRGFTDKVMMALNKDKNKSPIARLFRTRPVLAAAACVATLTAVAGTAYAVVAVVPLIKVNVTDPVDTPTGRQSVKVFSNDCSEISGKKYERKKTATFGPEKIADIVAAECNLQAIHKWAEQEHPDYALENNRDTTVQPNMQPGAENTFRSIIQPMAYKVVSITSTELSLEKINEQTPRNSVLQLNPDITFVVDHQYKTWRDIKPGDAIALVLLTTTVMRNDDTCNDQRCDTTTVSIDETLETVIKLDQPFEDYNKFGSLAEVVECDGNAADMCHMGMSLPIIDKLYQQNADYVANERTGIVSGVVQMHDAGKIVIKTTSGRLVTLHTPRDLIADFNATKSADFGGTTVAVGDTIQATYTRSADQVNVTDIQYDQLMTLYLIVEANSKGDLNPGGAFNKY